MSGELSNEDFDNDAVFSTLTVAILNTSAGGVINIMGPGLFHESLTTADSLTIRGPETGGVVIEPPCTGAGNDGITESGSGKTLILENLTIEGFAVDGVKCTDSNLQVRHCRIQANDVGIEGPGDNMRMQVIDSHVEANLAQGILFGAAANNWYISGSDISNNLGDGISLSPSASNSAVEVIKTRLHDNGGHGLNVDFENSACQVTVDECEVIGNTSDGLHVVTRAAGSFRVTNSVIEGNGADGVHVKNPTGCTSITIPKVKGIIEANRISGNVSNGVELESTGASCGAGNAASGAEASVFLNTISLNGAFGLKETGSPSSVDCGLGRNQLDFNVSGADSGSFCTVVTNDNKNQ